MTRGLKRSSFTSRATVRNACGRSITTLPSVTSGATAFWLELEPTTQRLLRFARRLEDAEPRGVGVLEDDVGAAADLRERLLLARAHVIPVADVRREHA